MSDSDSAPAVLDAAGLDAFLGRWSGAQGGERAEAQLFLSELADLLGVERPGGVGNEGAYAFERPVRFHDGPQQTTGFIDLYRRGAFVLETKQGVDEERAARGKRQRKGHGTRGSAAWEDTMTAAKNQAARYARNLEPGEPVPPFVVVADVGHCFDLYADFRGTGRIYEPFPDAAHHRLPLDALRDEAVRARLRAVFLDPLSLDPARRQAAVTRDLAERLASLAAALDTPDSDPEAVAGFLTRCLFCMFAEDADLIADKAFTELLKRYRDDLAHLPLALADFFAKMDAGGWVGEVKAQLPAFNGALFKDRSAPPLSADHLGLLLDAAARDWRAVEPAIFGTLLERALDPKERHRLGAHFTPRAYVERLVGPAVLEPLREEWAGVQAAVAAVEARAEGEDDRRRRTARDEARGLVTGFLRRLAAVRVLDPACGSGNFLYVTFAGLKALEAEVRQALRRLGGTDTLELEGVAVTPVQMRGIEVNARAAAVADLVLWIGYLQWHLRTYGDAQPLPEPILRGYGQVEHRDALLTTDADGEPAKAAWPEADFIVGNPPFIGAARMREALGDDYTETLRRVYADVPASADFVMHWWERAAEAVRRGEAERFGLITTNSITQTFNRRVVERHLGADDALALAFAVPDHPWVDGADGADVRVAMTVGVAAAHFDPDAGQLAVVVREESAGEAAEVELEQTTGTVHADLTVGADMSEAEPLEANADLSNRGVQLFGQGFIVMREEAEVLGLGSTAGLEQHIRPYLNGRDITQESRDRLVIDLFGLTADETRERFPEVYEHVLREVKPERDKNRRKSRRENWWLFGETNPKLREQLDELPRFIATPETAKHRSFVFLDASILPDNKLVVIALDDAYHLGVLSSRVHVEWALAAGGRLGVGNDPVYVKTKCFEPFPFPDATAAQQQEIRALGEAIDAHRNTRQAETGVTLTDLYNAVEALRDASLRVGRDLTAKEERAAEQGLAHTLLDLHRRLDRAVLAAYGWDLDPDAPAFAAAVLQRLVDLNRQRREEERAGPVRYLRPAFQNPEAAGQAGLDLPAAAPVAAPEAAPRPWPRRLADQTVAVRQAVAALSAAGEPADAGAVAARFAGAGPRTVAPVLDALAELGLLRTETEGVFAA